MKPLLIVTLVMLSQLAAPQFPQAEISNASIRATLYLPDAQSGYYRGTRFDWSGVDRQPEVERPRVLRAVVRAPRPEDPRRHHRAGRGVPHRRFRARLRRGEAGRDVRADRRRRRPQARRSPPTGGSRPTRSSIPASGRSTRARTGSSSSTSSRHGGLRLRLSQDAPARQGHAGPRAPAEEHRPQARSRRASTTTTSSRWTASRPAPTSSCGFRSTPRAARPLNDLAEIRGNDVAFLREFEPRGRRSSPRSRDSARPRRTTTSGSRTARPARACASPATGRCRRCYFWSAHLTVCPEPYIDVSVEPGKESSWRITYQFYQAAGA